MRKRLPEKEVLVRHYCNELKSTVEIGKLYGVNPGSVIKALKRAHIKIRPREESWNLAWKQGKIKSRSDRRVPPKEVLQRLYKDELKSVTQIADLYGVSARSVYDKFEREGIPRRNYREAVTLAIRQGRRRPRPMIKGYKLKEILRCKKCLNVWKNTEVKAIQKCPSCGATISAYDDQKYETSMRIGYKTWLQLMLQYPTAFTAEEIRSCTKAWRKCILLLVGRGKLECVRCGCDRPELLEINHKNGGGKKEFESIGRYRFYQNIRQLRRNLDDLELTCRVCNALHYLELQNGKLPYSIIYNKAIAIEARN